jgi:hypothetical protein
MTKGKARASRVTDDGEWAVEVESEGPGGKADVKERWMNLAPVKDFVVVKEEGGGMVGRNHT